MDIREIIAINLGNLANTFRNNGAMLEGSGLPVVAQAFHSVATEIEINAHNTLAAIEDNFVKRLSKLYGLSNVSELNFTGLDELRHYFRATKTQHMEHLYSSRYCDVGDIDIITKTPSLDIVVRVYDPIEFDYIPLPSFLSYLPQSTVDAVIDSIKTKVGYFKPTWEDVDTRMDDLLISLVEQTTMTSVGTFQDYYDRWSKEAQVIKLLQEPVANKHYSTIRLNAKNSLAPTVTFFSITKTDEPGEVEIAIVSTDDHAFHYYRNVGDPWKRVLIDESCDVYLFHTVVDVLEKCSVGTIDEGVVYLRCDKENEDV